MVCDSHSHHLSPWCWITSSDLPTTTHFHLIHSILEDVNNTINFGPFFIDDLLSHYYIKPSGARCTLYKWAYKKHVCFFPNKTNHVDTADYKVSGNCTIGGLRLWNFKCNFSGIPECFTFCTFLILHASSLANFILCRLEEIEHGREVNWPN